jgi:hypothetical protein
MSHEVDFIAPIHNKKSKVSKRGRDFDQSDLNSKVLAAFSETEHLTLKELATYCKCTDADVKDLLEIYAKYNKAGKFKNYYELKPEFKDKWNEGRK